MCMCIVYIHTPVLLCQVRYFVLDGARLPPHYAGQNCGRTISVLSLHAIPHREMHHVPFLCASSRLDHLIEIIVVRLSLFGRQVHADIMKMTASTTHGCSLQCLVMCCPVMQTLKIRSIYSWACNVYPQNVCKFQCFVDSLLYERDTGKFSRWCNPKRHVTCKNEDPLQKSDFQLKLQKKKRVKSKNAIYAGKMRGAGSK